MISKLGSLSQMDISRSLFDSYERYKFREIDSRRFKQKDMLRWIEPYVRANVLKSTPLGASAEGRMISLYSYGSGPTKILLWSQMHGDEPTATMALIDIFNLLSERGNDEIVAAVGTNLQLLVIPMLNPDGAERFSRRTAQLVDMNRDAASLATPEAKILREAQKHYRPQFGFNLHDQDPRLTVGRTKKVTAIALLAPAIDESRRDDDVRLKAKRVADGFARALHPFISGHLAKYDDTFEFRAFGDNVQRWGTSTVLVESGGWPQDRDKMFIRKLNYAGILSSLYSVATGEYQTNDLTMYDALPFNSKNLYDVIVRGAEFRGSDRAPAVRVDIAFNIEESARQSGGVQLNARVVDLGDLSNFGAFDERNGKGISLRSSQIQLDGIYPWDHVELLLK
jgi:hypothetical protein